MPIKANLFIHKINYRLYSVLNYIKNKYLDVKSSGVRSVVCSIQVFLEYTHIFIYIPQCYKIADYFIENNYFNIK